MFSKLHLCRIFSFYYVYLIVFFYDCVLNVPGKANAVEISVFIWETHDIIS